MSMVVLIEDHLIQTPPLKGIKMRYRKLDSAGDMKFGHQQYDFLQDTPETVGQAVQTKLALWVGEWFLDTDEGTPYEQAMLGMGKSKSIEPAIRKRILETEGVTEIEFLELLWNPDTRQSGINVTINTEYGITEFQGVL